MKENDREYNKEQNLIFRINEGIKMNRPLFRENGSVNK